MNIEVLKQEHHLNIVGFVKQSGTSLAEIPEDVEGSAESTPAPPDELAELSPERNGGHKELIGSGDPSSQFQLESEIFR